MKKVLALSVGVLMCTALFVGCSSNEPSTSETTTQATTQAALELKSDDLVGAWRQSDEINSGESDFDIATENPDFIYNLTFNADGTGQDWLGAPDAATKGEFTWTIEGDKVIMADATFPSQTLEATYKDGKLTRNMAPGAPNTDVVFSKSV